MAVDEEEYEMDTTTQAGITGIRTVAVPVGDQDRALEFYRDVLGFEVRLDGQSPAGRWLEVEPAGSATSIALVADDGQGAGVDTGIRLTTANADATHAALLAQGVDVDPEVLRFGEYVPPMFTFRDQDGNVLVVVEA
ncbi:VOC family protein [Pseudonocardia aurantiaca]